MALNFTPLFASKQVDDVSADVLFTLITSPSNLLFRNGRIRFVNTTAGFVTIKVWAVPAAGSVGDSNLCLPTTSIGVNGFIDVDIPVLRAGASVQAQAGSAASVTAEQMDGFLQS